MEDRREWLGQNGHISAFVPGFELEKVHYSIVRKNGETPINRNEQVNWGEGEGDSNPHG